MKTTLKTIPLFSLILLTTLACNLVSAPPSPAPTGEPLFVLEPTVALADPTATPETANQETLVPTLAPTAVPPTPSQGVVFTVNSESLNIRRGPGIYYNTVGVIAAGQSVPVLGRDATGGWLYISLPSNPSAFGWVAAETQYSSIKGDLGTLEKMTVPPADPIIIKNCTYHPMLVEPGGFTLSGQTDTTKFMKQVTPGFYTVSDTTVNAQVAAQALFEGDVLIIYTDGLNNTYPCP